MVISKFHETAKTDIKINNETLEQVNSFKYLGQTITPGGKNELEISIKIASAKNRFQQLYKVLTSKKIALKLRHRLLVCYIFSVILYGCETWTLTKPLIDKLEACEMWFFRRMGKISWKEKTTNQAVLTKLNLKRSLMNTIKERKLAYFGHTKRHPSMMRNILEGKMQGKRPKGRPRAQWADIIKEWTGCSLNECTRLARNRDAWRRSLSRQPLNQ